MSKKLNIIYEDNDVIVVIKPTGIESQSSKGLESDMVSLIRNYLYKKNLSNYVGVIHRLDKNVTGIMVFAKNKNTAKWLSKQVSEGNIKKKYIAIACGKIVDKCGKLEDYLCKNSKNNISEIIDKDKLNLYPNAKLARLNYKVLEYITIDKKEYTKVDIELITGRHHQIRVQFAGFGYPLRGDRKYGNDIGSGNIDLRSYYIEFYHERLKKMIKFDISSVEMR